MARSSGETNKDEPVGRWEEPGRDHDHHATRHAPFRLDQSAPAPRPAFFFSIAACEAFMTRGGVRRVWSTAGPNRPRGAALPWQQGRGRAGTRRAGPACLETAEGRVAMTSGAEPRGVAGSGGGACRLEAPLPGNKGGVERAGQSQRAGPVSVAPRCHDSGPKGRGLSPWRRVAVATGAESGGAEARARGQAQGGWGASAAAGPGAPRGSAVCSLLVRLPGTVSAAGVGAGLEGRRRRVGRVSIGSGPS